MHNRGARTIQNQPRESPSRAQQFATDGELLPGIYGVSIHDGRLVGHHAIGLGGAFQYPAVDLKHLPGNSWPSELSRGELAAALTNF